MEGCERGATFCLDFRKVEDIVDNGEQRSPLLRMISTPLLVPAPVRYWASRFAMPMTPFMGVRIS
jgi:hypothetical protein